MNVEGRKNARSCGAPSRPFPTLCMSCFAAPSPGVSAASARLSRTPHSPPKSFASSASACLSRPPSADATPRAACASYMYHTLQGIESSVGSRFCGGVVATVRRAHPTPWTYRGQGGRYTEVRAGARHCAEHSRAPRGYEGTRGQRIQRNAAGCSGVRERECACACPSVCVNVRRVRAFFFPALALEGMRTEPRHSRDVAEV